MEKYYKSKPDFEQEIYERLEKIEQDYVMRKVKLLDIIQKIENIKKAS